VASSAIATQTYFSGATRELAAKQHYYSHKQPSQQRQLSLVLALLDKKVATQTVSL
jgi:hypothetical protein